MNQDEGLKVMKISRNSLEIKIKIKIKFILLMRGEFFWEGGLLPSFFFSPFDSLLKIAG
jgi:hypothetical protein